VEAVACVVSLAGNSVAYQNHWDEPKEMTLSAKKNLADADMQTMVGMTAAAAADAKMEAVAALIQGLAGLNIDPGGTRAQVVKL
jgi:CTP:molybdopterin cytidylyltransferase MocA